jgi:hypothetical protein
MKVMNLSPTPLGAFICILLTMSSSTFGNNLSSGVKKIAEERGHEEAVRVLHGMTSPFVQEYLSLVKGLQFSAASYHGSTPDVPLPEMERRLKKMYEMSSMSDWVVDAAWPIVPDGSTVGFVYRIKVVYLSAHYYLLTAVLVDENRIFIKDGIGPESGWLESYRVPSIENPEQFALGEIRPKSR